MAIKFSQVSDQALSRFPSLSKLYNLQYDWQISGNVNEFVIAMVKFLLSSSEKEEYLKNNLLGILKKNNDFKTRVFSSIQFPSSNDFFFNAICLSPISTLLKSKSETNQFCCDVKR